MRVKLQGLALVAVVAMSANAARAQDAEGACPATQRMSTKAGQHAALSSESFDALNAALRANDKAALDALVQQKLALPLPAGAAVCVRASASGARQVEVNGVQGLVWVSEQALGPAR